MPENAEIPCSARFALNALLNSPGEKKQILKIVFIHNAINAMKLYELKLGLMSKMIKHLLTFAVNIIQIRFQRKIYTMQ